MEGAQINATQMAGAQMDTAQKNATQMDGARMNEARMNGAQRESSKSSKNGDCKDGFDFWDWLYSALTGTASRSASCGLLALVIKLYKYINRKYFEKVENDLISNI
jgi:hypothetical protein